MTHKILEKLIAEAECEPLGLNPSQRLARELVLAHTSRDDRIDAILQVIERLWRDLPAREVRGDSPIASTWLEQSPRIH